MSFAGDPAGISREMGSWSLASLLALPVRLQGIELGRPVDVILDVDAWRVVGLEVGCGDGTHRFLPLAGTRIGDQEIAVSSPFALLDELTFYRSRGRALQSLRGSGVSTEAGRLGTLRDLTFELDGVIRELVVDAPGGELRFPPDPSVRIATRRAPAA